MDIDKNSINVGSIFFITAPSGSGKDTLIDGVSSMIDDVELIVKATTRPRRDNEKEGVNYYYMDDNKFKALEDSSEFLHIIDAYNARYGILGEELRRKVLSEGKNIIITSHGFPEMQDVKERLLSAGFPNVHSIFIHVDKDKILSRLRGRGSETDEEIEHRMAKDMAFYDEIIGGKISHFDHVVSNNASAQEGIDSLYEVMKGCIQKR